MEHPTDTPLAPGGRKVISLHDHRATVETKHVENRTTQKDGVGFTICRRLINSKPEHHHEWTALDNCFQCSLKVLYDRRDSEGIPHICLPCASELATGNFLKGLDNAEVAQNAMSDEEHWARIQASISQHKHNEHKR